MIEENNITPPSDHVHFIKEGLKIGFINGAFALLIMYCSYYMGLDAFVNVQVAAKFIPYMSVILVIYGLQLRRRNGGFLPFKDGIKYSYLSYIISSVLIAVGTYILFTMIDPELTQKSFDLMIEKLKQNAQTTGRAPAELEAMIAEAAKQKQTTTGSSIIGGLGFELILEFVLSIIIALIIRREKPLLTQS